MISRRTMMNDEIVSKSGNIAQLEKCKGSYLNGLQLFGKSEQQKTAGAQLLDPKLFDEDKTISGFSVHSNGDGSVDIKKTETGTGTVLYKLGDITDKLESGNYYTASNFDISGALRIQFEQIRESGPLYSNKFKFDSSIDKQVNVRIFLLSNETISGTIYPMVNVGQIALPWEPYTGGMPSPSIKYPQEIVSAGRNGSVNIGVNGANLFSCKHHFSKVLTNNGITITVKDNELILNGTAIRNADFYFDSKLWNSLVNGEYTFSFEKKTELKCFLSLINKFHEDNNGKITFNKNNEYKFNYFIFRCASGSTFNNFIVKPMLNIGKNVLPYEPYRIPQKLILKTQNGLPGVPVSKDGNYTDEKGQQWVCDEIDLGRGKYVQRLAEQVYNKISFILIDENNNKFQNVSSGIYKFKGSLYPSMSNFARYAAWANNKGSFSAFNEYFYYRHTEKITVDELNTLFNSMMPIKILGQLEEPIERDLTAEEIEQYKALHTYTGTTVLSNDAEVYMKATYRKFK